MVHVRLRSLPVILVPVLVYLLSACSQGDYTPKPRGFFKIDLPEKEYKALNSDCPYEFEIPRYAELTDDRSRNAEPCWKNIDFPQFNARLHLSYFPISRRAPFETLTEDARTFVFKHTSKATSIDQELIRIPQKKVYGIRYEIGGNTASNIQFYVSDSTRHYLRGALYFNEKPNLDSIRPVLEFIRQDIDHIINTLHWK